MTAPLTCPVDRDVDLMDPGFLRDPFPYLAAQRADTPVFYVPEVNLYFITRYDDAEEAFINRDTYSASNASSPVWAPCPAAKEILSQVPLKPTLNNADDPRHKPMRLAVVTSMTPRRLRGMGPVLEEIARDLLEKMAAKPVADIMADLAVPLPGFAGFSLLGFPEEDWEMIKKWCTRRVQLTYGRLSEEQQVEVAKTNVLFWQYCEAHVEKRRLEATDDLTSDLIAHQAEHSDEMDPTDITRIVWAIALAGHDSTTAAIGGGLRHLLGRPDEWARLVEDPALIPRAVEEMLRFDPPILGHRRVAKVDVEVGGVLIPAGSHILMVLASAHRDSDHFDDPDEFDITRDNARDHLSFGKGAHLCAGAPLARLEMKLMLEAMVEIMPNVRLVDDQVIDVVPNIMFRNLEQLLVEPGVV
ncbi:MAG: putative cytochrome hydroxylase [Aeromicrobium sp.]|nr:putative cytochrome hydroxylase [Aeromicrobium sp.]